MTKKVLGWLLAALIMAICTSIVCLAFAGVGPVGNFIRWTYSLPLVLELLVLVGSISGLVGVTTILIMLVGENLIKS